MGRLARVEVRERGEHCLVRVVGEVDISNAGEVLTEIETAVPDETWSIALDLTEATYMDSAGVQLLFMLAERLRARRRRLRMIVPEDAPLRDVLELTGVPKCVALEPTLNEEDDLPG
jgi:anti-anti-sigma factor